MTNNMLLRIENMHHKQDIFYKGKILSCQTDILFKARGVLDADTKEWLSQ